MARSLTMTKEELLGKALLDRIFLGHFCFGRDFREDSADSHYELNTLLGGDERFIVVVCHRGWAKSTILCFLDIVHQIGFNQKGDVKFMVVISETQAQSMNHVARVADAVRFNERYRWLFGDLYTGGRKWGMKEIITNNGSRVCAVGTGQRVRGLIEVGGQRPTHTVLDDCESRYNARTPEQRQENMDWFLSDVFPYRDQIRGRIVVVQSPVAHDCIVYRLTKNPEWRQLVIPLYSGDFGTGSIAWPSYWSWDKIKAERRNYENEGLSGLFDQEYLLIPYKGEGAGIQRSDLRYFTGQFGKAAYGVKALSNFQETDQYGDPLPGQMPGDFVVSSSTGCDPALGEQKIHCETAFVNTLVDSQGNWYIHSFNAFRKNSAFYIGNEFAEYSWGVDADALGVETVHFQSAIGEVVAEWCKSHNVSFDCIRGFNPRSSKDSRLEWVMNKIKAKKVFVRPEHTKLIKALLEYPGGELDLLDALYYAMKVSYPPGESDPEKAKSKATKVVEYSNFYDRFPSHKVLV